MEEFEDIQYITFIFFVRGKGDIFNRRESHQIPQKGIKYLKSLNPFYKKQLKAMKFDASVDISHEIELDKVPFTEMFPDLLIYLDIFLRHPFDKDVFDTESEDFFEEGEEDDDETRLERFRRRRRIKELKGEEKKTRQKISVEILKGRRRVRRKKTLKDFIDPELFNFMEKRFGKVTSKQSEKLGKLINVANWVGFEELVRSLSIYLVEHYLKGMSFDEILAEFPQIQPIQDDDKTIIAGIMQGVEGGIKENVKVEMEQRIKEKVTDLIEEEKERMEKEEEEQREFVAPLIRGKIH